MAGLAPAIGQSISVGTRNTAPTLGDTSMAFEVARVPVTSVSLDPATDKIIFKGTLEEAGGYTINEIGLWSSSDSLDSSLILTFDETTEGWDSSDPEATEPPFTTIEEAAASRVGQTLMNIPVAGATPTTIVYSVEETDLTGLLGPDDTWSIAFNKTGASVLNVNLKLTSAEGSLTLTFFPSNISSTGYTFGSTSVKSGMVTGTFDPSAILQFDLTVQPAAGNSVSGNVQLDAVVATNAPAERDGSVLVARAVISPVFKTSPSGGTDLEYELGVSV